MLFKVIISLAALVGVGAMSLPIGRFQSAQMSQQSQQYDRYPVKARPFGYPAYSISQLKVPRIRFGGSVPYSVYGGYIPAPYQQQYQEVSISSGLNTVDQQAQTGSHAQAQGNQQVVRKTEQDLAHFEADQKDKYTEPVSQESLVVQQAQTGSPAQSQVNQEVVRKTEQDLARNEANQKESQTQDHNVGFGSSNSTIDSTPKLNSTDAPQTSEAKHLSTYTENMEPEPKNN